LAIDPNRLGRGAEASRPKSVRLRLIWSEVCQVRRRKRPAVCGPVACGGGSASAGVDGCVRLICAGRDRMTGCASLRSGAAL